MEIPISSDAIWHWRMETRTRFWPHGKARCYFPTISHGYFFGWLLLAWVSAMSIYSRYQSTVLGKQDSRKSKERQEGCASAQG
jgi:hypothetical protein